MNLLPVVIRYRCNRQESMTKYYDQRTDVSALTQKQNEDRKNETRRHLTTVVSNPANFADARSSAADALSEL
jgi:hypothetical protein